MTLTALVALSLCLLCSPLHAKKTSEPPKKSATAVKPASRPVTIDTVVTTTMKKGKDWVLLNPRAGNLDYTAEMKAKKLLVGNTADGAELSSIVILGDDGATPRDMIFSVTHGKYEGKALISIDGYSFRANLNGGLVSGIRARGPVSNVVQDRLDVSASAVKSEFDKTVNSFLTHPTFATK